MTETYGLLVHNPPQFQNTPTRWAFTHSGQSQVYWSPHWYTRRVKEAIHVRLHPNNINTDNGIEIPEARITIIRNQHSNRSVRMLTYEGTASQSRSNNEDRNAPIVVNQGATNSDKQTLTSLPDKDLQYSNQNVVIYILKSLHRETNKWKIHQSCN